MEVIDGQTPRQCVVCGDEFIRREPRGDRVTAMCCGECVVADADTLLARNRQAPWYAEWAKSHTAPVRDSGDDA